MGVINSKSPLERRNTVLRRSQRKSIHGVKSKTEKLMKDIKKFKGIEEDAAYIDLKARIETLDRDLKIHKNLQPQLKFIHTETLKKVDECHKLLIDTLKENQDKHQEKQQQQQTQKADEDSINDDVFIEEVKNEEQQLEESTNKRRTVELNLIQVEAIEASPQVHKRESILKMGVPVMPVSMMEALYKKTQDLNLGIEDKIADIRHKIEDIEIEISTFVGKKNGKYYRKIKDQLEGYSKELNMIQSQDEVIMEQTKICSNYVTSCLSFLDEKAVDDNNDSDDSENGADVDDDSNTNMGKSSAVVTNSNFSPRNIRTTYI